MFFFFEVIIPLRLFIFAFVLTFFNKNKKYMASILFEILPIGTYIRQCRGILFLLKISTHKCRTNVYVVAIFSFEVTIK